MTAHILRTGICQIETKDNVTVLSASFKYPFSICVGVEIAEASSIRIEKNVMGEIIRIFISDITPKEEQ